MFHDTTHAAFIASGRTARIGLPGRLRRGQPSLRSDRAEVRDEVALLFLGQLETEHEVEEFDRVIQREESSVVQVRG